MNGNNFATGQILEKPVEVVKGWILAGWAQKSSEPLCHWLSAILALNYENSWTLRRGLITPLKGTWTHY
jgi:hypothetical protein